MELGPFDINVNTIQPGLVAGERQERVIAAKAAARGITPEQQRADLLRHVSMGRFVTQQEIADMALYLSSDGGPRRVRPGHLRVRRPDRADLTAGA